MFCGWEGNQEGLASYLPCVTDFSGLSTYRLRKMSTPRTLFMGYDTLYLTLIGQRSADAWPGGLMVRALNLGLQRWRVQLPILRYRLGS